MNQPPFEAFSGDQPYIFISYAHLDADLVFPIISDWHARGYRIWYDEGIDPGNEWPEEIANALESCTQFLVFVSPRSVLSKNVKNEINFALDMDKDFIAIHLEKTDLPSGLRLRMGDIQAIMKYRMPETMFDNKMNRALLSKAFEPVTTPVVEAPVEMASPPAASEPETEAEKPSQPTPETSPSSANKGSQFLYKNIADMTPKEIKNAVLDDLSNIKDEATALFKNEMANLKKTGSRRRESLTEKRLKRQELKLAKKQLLDENSELTDEIRREIHASLKKPKYKKRSGCFLRVPLILLIIFTGVYFIFIVDRYDSLSEDFLNTNCPSLYSPEKKFELINHYDTTLKSRQKKWALEQDIHKCEAATDKSVKEKELGLNTMSLDELENLLISRMQLVKSLNIKWHASSWKPVSAPK